MLIKMLSEKYMQKVEKFCDTRKLMCEDCPLSNGEFMGCENMIVKNPIKVLKTIKEYEKEQIK